MNKSIHCKLRWKYAGYFYCSDNYAVQVIEDVKRDKYTCDRRMNVVATIIV